MNWSLIAVLMLSILLVAGCGGEADGGTEGDTEQIEEITDPEVLGNRVSDVYLDMYSSLNNLVNSGLTAEELWPELTAMKENYIGQFVVLGAVREGMTEEQREAANWVISSRSYDLDRDIFNSVNDAIAIYREQDNDLANEIAHFNILSQYSDYELLRAQEPEEATRLGI